MPVTITYEINERVKMRLVIARISGGIDRVAGRMHTYGVIKHDKRYENATTGVHRALIEQDWDTPDAIFTHEYGAGLGTLTIKAIQALEENGQI